MLFATINPVTAFNEGKIIALTKINVVSVYDNLVDTARFKYTVATEDEVLIASGEVSLTPDNYSQWDSSAEGAHRIVAQQLGFSVPVAATFSLVNGEANG